MKLLRELNEPTNFDSILAQVATACTQFLDNPVPIYRGMNGGNMAGRVSIRQDRQPKDSSYLDTMFFNYIYGHVHGFYAAGATNLRGRVLFASVSERVARQYGAVKFVFPVDGSVVHLDPHLQDSGYITEVLGELYHEMVASEERKNFEHEWTSATRMTNDDFRYLVGKFLGVQDFLESSRAVSLFRKYQRIAPDRINDVVDSDTELMIEAQEAYVFDVEAVKSMFGTSDNEQAFKELVNKIHQLG